MTYDYCIVNGRVIDPAAGTDTVRPLYVKGTHIVQPAPGEDAISKVIIDAAGCIVLPGLTDFHTHLGYQMSDFGLNPDLYTLPNGITSAVDAGSGGTANWEGMYTNIFTKSMIDIRCFVNIAATGIITECYQENLEPSRVDVEKMQYLVEKYPAAILGFKVRAGKNTSGRLGLKPLEKAVKLGERFHKRVCLHATNLEHGYDEITSIMRKGDVICHIFQGDNENTILDKQGHVADFVWKAREKGIIFDNACGRVNYSNRIMKHAFLDKFYPDIISTDIIGFSIYGPKIHSLLSVMSHYLAMDVALYEVIKAVTATPAAVMGLAGVTGTLVPGAKADIFITRLKDSPFDITDKFGVSVHGEKVFEPLLTMKAGQLTYRNIFFDKMK